MRQGTKANNRKRLVVEPRIQYSLVRQLINHWILYLVASVTLLTILELLLGGVFNSWQYHYERLAPIIATLVIALAFMAPAFILNSLQLSSRFVGPIHRVRRHLRQIADGENPDKLEFRKADFWRDVSDELEAALAATRLDAISTLETASGSHVGSQESTGVVLTTEDTVPISDLNQTEAR